MSNFFNANKILGLFKIHTNQHFLQFLHFPKLANNIPSKNSRYVIVASVYISAFFFTVYMYCWCRFYLFFAENFLILTAIWEGLGYLVVLLRGWGKRFDLGVILVKVKFRLWGWSLLILIAPLLKIKNKNNNS